MTSVLLEHLTLSAQAADCAVMGVECLPLPPGRDPVAAGFARVADALSHSTSWRYEEGSVVLTFVHVLPDRTPLVGPWMGSPEDLESEPVACHAVRHLHFLRHTDEEVAAAPGLSVFWAFAARVADHHYPAVAGLLSAHDLSGMDFSI
jgi:hypothetical protein